MDNRQTKTTEKAPRLGLGPCGRALQRHLGLRKDKEIGPGLRRGARPNNDLNDTSSSNTSETASRGFGRGLGRGRRLNGGQGRGMGRRSNNK